MQGDLKTESIELLGFYAEWNLSCADLKCAIADILPHSGHKYDILDAHLPSIRQGERFRPFAQRRQRRNNTFVDCVRARK
jgi:hypothetical protein